MSWKDELKMSLIGDIDILIINPSGLKRKLKYNKRNNLYIWKDTECVWTPMKLVEHLDNWRIGSTGEISYTIRSIISTLGMGDTELSLNEKNLHTVLRGYIKDSDCKVFINGRMFA